MNDLAKEFSLAEIDSESAQSALRDAMIAEALGDIQKLRAEIAEIRPQLAEAMESHVAIGREMIDQQKKHFGNMAASEIERINAEHTAKADVALAGAARSLKTTSEKVNKIQSATMNAVIWSASIGALIAAVISSGVAILLLKSG